MAYFLKKQLTKKVCIFKFMRVFMTQKEVIQLTNHSNPLAMFMNFRLTRLLQFKVLKNNYSSEDIFDFIHDFRVAQISERKYINLTKATTFIKEFSALTNLPLTSYFLSEGEIKKMLSHRF